MCIPIWIWISCTLWPIYDKVEFPLYIGSMKESMQKKLCIVNMHPQGSQESTQHKVDKSPKDKVSSDNKIPNKKTITWRISIKRYLKEWDIHLHMPNKRKQDTNWRKTNTRYLISKRELGSHKPNPQQIFMMAQSIIKSKTFLPSTHTWWGSNDFMMGE